MSLENYGEYQLIKKLATGGMAQIYLARQQGLEGFEKLLVVKRILPHLAENEDFIKMFLDEARIAARLNHPNIVQIFNLGSQDDTFFIAMEYIHGEDVRRVWKRADQAGKDLPVPMVCRIIMDAAAGLDYAHKKTDQVGKPLGIVHRDISPQNILVTFEGGVKVVDFGIAKAADQATVTKSGVLKGKYSYMSPEQASGQKIDHRTDIFALGTVLYELLTGTRLFKRSNDIQTLNAVTECQVALPSEVNDRLPKSLDAVVMKALAKRADDRYVDASALQGALEDWLLENKLASSSVHLAAFLQEIYADRLKREAEEGRVLVEELDQSRNLMEAAGRATPASKGGSGLRQAALRPNQNEINTSSLRDKQQRELTRAERSGERSSPLPRNTGATSKPRLDQRLIDERERRSAELSASVSITQTENAKSRFPWGIAVVVALIGSGVGIGAYLATRANGAVVRIDSDPPGATVKFRGQTLASIATPCALPRMPAGSYPVVLEKKGYRALEANVTYPERGEVTLAAFKLEPDRGAEQPAVVIEAAGGGAGEVAAARVAFTVTSQPSGATVFVDGAKVGVTPLTMPVEPKASLAVRVSLGGYKDDDEQITAAAADFSKAFTLEKVKRTEHQVVPVVKKDEPVATPVKKEFGKVRFVVKPWAEVVCGEFKLGDTPFQDKQLPVGHYLCTFANPDFGKRTRPVDVSANETTRVSVNFNDGN